MTEFLIIGSFYDPKDVYSETFNKIKKGLFVGTINVDFVTKQKDGNPFSGQIEDSYGSAMIKGTISDTGMSFSKKYLDGIFGKTDHEVKYDFLSKNFGRFPCGYTGKWITNDEIPMKGEAKCSLHEII
ncbi:MAG: hypothetical protein WDK96_01025 [Candidatus Paceibacterota bacterium]|jgi:hypothetical protein